MSEKVFRIIAMEFQAGRLHGPTWARACAEAGGDDTKAKAAYIRLRQATLEARLEGTSPAHEAETPRYRSELELKREMLTKRLQASGKTSFYQHLDLEPTADDSVVAAAIADFRREESEGRQATAEERYALETLGNPVSREHYDRKLLEILTPPGGNDSRRPLTTPPSSSKSWYPILAGILVAVLAYWVAGSYEQRTKERLRNNFPFLMA